MQKKHPIYDMVAPTIENMGFEVVRIMTTGTQKVTVQIMIERQDHKNLVVDDCAAVSRAVSAILDEKDPIDGEYSLEVSSPVLIVLLQSQNILNALLDMKQKSKQMKLLMVVKDLEVKLFQ